MFGGGAHRPGARHRPHRPPAAPRRQPARVQRQPGHRPRLARPDRGADRRAAAGSWWSTPAAPAPPSGPTSTCAIRPGTDALLLAAMVHAGRRGPGRPRRASATHVSGSTSWSDCVAPFTPEAVAARDRHRRRHHPPPGPRPGRRADRRVVYGRIGTTTAEFGTLACWLVDVLNIVTGNLDRPGGAMFTKAAAGAANTRGAPGTGRGAAPRPPPQPGAGPGRVRWASCPVVAWPRRSTRPGEGQVRALVTVAGNPVLSTPEQRAGSTPRSPASSSWWPSTSTSTRPPATPT